MTIRARLACWYSAILLLAMMIIVGTIYDEIFVLSKAVGKIQVENLHNAVVCMLFVLSGLLVGCTSPPSKVSAGSDQLQQRMGAGVTNPPAGV